ncbi:MAG: membrane protein insertase YidC [Clostridia bacterium]|nr:membrane protein insertase YidC [Clostridia bacterium]
MDTVIYYICLPLAYLMKGLWLLVGNYGVAIVLFTLASKIILFPVSAWIQKNSILMVKIQPEINFLKANYAGNLDAIAEGQAKLYKREHYHPMLSLIPLVIQILLLLAVVYIIYHPMGYLFGVSNDAVKALADYIGADTGDSGFQLAVIQAIKDGTITAATPVEGISSAELADIISKVSSFKLSFLGMNLCSVPSKVLGWYFLLPVFAGFSSWIMCFTQNLSNVIQHEQGKLNKYGIMAVSVALSLYLGFFVPAGIAVYWIAGNLLSIAQMYILNAIINPKKYVDYKLLEESRKALADSKAFGKMDKKDPLYKQMKARQKQDYKKFMHIVNKHIVFYSEKSGFYKYYKELIAELLKRSNLVIHYVTNDFNDVIFEIAKDEPRIKPYYIGLKKTALLMMLVETDIFVMTTPDLDKYYLKRSFIKKDTEYIYAPHDSMSAHLGFNDGAFDAFDTILCVGQHFADEMRAIIALKNLPDKNLVEFGFPLLDNLVEAGRKENENRQNGKVKEILIAPSWQEDNILDSCIDEIIGGLYGKEYKISVRPHPEYVKRYGYQLSKLLERYKDYDKELLSFELDFSNNKSVYSSDLLITDWSGIAAEFCFATERPALFVNTKPKINNPEWEKVGIMPVEMTLRKELGVDVEKQDLGNICGIVKDLFKNQNKYKTKIRKYYEDFTFNHGTAAEKGAQYILKSLSQKSKNKK